MADRNDAYPVARSVEIAYEGTEAEHDAGLVWQDLSAQLRLAPARPERLAPDALKLGASSMIIKIMLSLVEKGWEAILELLRKRVQAPTFNVGEVTVVIVGDEGGLPRRFPLRRDTDWDELTRTIAEHVTTVTSLPLAQAIAEDLNTDMRKRRMLEAEATFADVEVCSSSVLRANAPSLGAVAYSFEQYHDYVREHAARNNGLVLKAGRDEVLMCFPTARDALSCSIGLFKGKDSFNRERNALRGEFQFRIGVNTGMALANEGLDFHSEVLEVARTLQREAAPGSVVVSESTFQQLRRPASLRRHKYIRELRAWTYLIEQPEHRQRGAGCEPRLMEKPPNHMSVD